ncbi:MAG: M28 family peptidase [Spirochaetaceae bacterium]|nr:M28 family peptidase [Myxococcales bacterium]MCB9723319.1 M28 family peptidase [Spirochaetaceae bacterium]
MAGAALADALPTVPAIDAADLERHVRALTDPRAAGRLTGSPGESFAAGYVSRRFEQIGLEPAAGDGSDRHAFEFTAGLSLGPDNALVARRADGESLAFSVDRDWRPLAFSESGDFAQSPVVFAGYGVVSPENESVGAIDDYAGLDVRDRWVLVFRDLPHAVEGHVRQHLQRYAGLRHKAMLARDRGARGLLLVSGPGGRFREALIPLRFDASLSGSRIAVLSLADAAAETLLAGSAIGDLADLQAAADARLLATATGGTASTSPPAETKPWDPHGHLLEGVTVHAVVDLVTERGVGRNVVARLRVGDVDSAQTIVLGAHYDHLGHGEGSASLATGDEVGRVHPGADDNASGVAVLLEIAESLADRRRRGEDLGDRDFVFAAWSGEELGLLGSDRWVADHVNPHSREAGPVAYLNFDMVGRLRDDLVVQGLGSSDAWTTILDQVAAADTLRIHRQDDAYLPTDATPFYMQRVPVLSAFTGVHPEYHTPRDTADRLDYAGAAAIARLFETIAVELSTREEPPPYRAQAVPTGEGARSGFRVFLGTVPDYANTDVRGVRLSGVAPDGPAERAGLQGGDVIVEVDGRPIENLYDYTYALEALRVGEPARIVVERGGRRIPLEVVPASRD